MFIFIVFVKAWYDFIEYKVRQFENIDSMILYVSGTTICQTRHHHNDNLYM